MGDPENAVMALLAEREQGATICPSEVARRVASSDHPDAWRAHMAKVHAAVDVLVERGEVRLSWKGTPLATREGPYRIGRDPR